MRISPHYNDYCEYYASCQHRLEIEQRHCVKMKEKLDRGGAKCLKLVNVARAAVDGLQLRKAEVERDCVMKSDGDQPRSLKQRAICKRVIQRFPNLLTDEFIHKFGKIPIKIRRQHSNIKACRESARLLRKQCHMLARCCPLHSCPELGIVRSQISSATTFLHHLKWKCLKQNY
ncbi:unnamed protein product [Wuchereria bancrofti]|uniref:Uncharacterized protein n=1 Tax=Wuchereria bancrofti TaxID=6293 RepID=A0A3P7EFZ3_WUCBA|nr:unnamed protein product [Wuchereria bancrofti]